MLDNLDHLINRLKQDDKEAFNSIFYCYVDKLHRLGMSYFNLREEAEEIVQEVFLKIWLKRHSIRDATTFNAYIFTIAKNLIFNNLKKKIHQQKYRSYLSCHQPTEYTTDNDIIFEETDQLIQSALKQLPKKRKLVFLLSRKVGLKNKDIAKRLNISIKTVETHMTLSLKHLKEAVTLNESKICLLLFLVADFIR